MYSLFQYLSKYIYFFTLYEQTPTNANEFRLKKDMRRERIRRYWQNKAGAHGERKMDDGGQNGKSETKMDRLGLVHTHTHTHRMNEWPKGGNFTDGLNKAAGVLKNQVKKQEELRG